MPSKKVIEPKTTEVEQLEIAVSDSVLSASKSITKTEIKNKKLVTQVAGQVSGDPEKTVASEKVVVPRKTRVAKVTTQEGGEPTTKTKISKTKKVKSGNGEDDSEVLQDRNGRKLRSFKVKLPDKDEYEGRFTGLTPYQAANKALSKYFRTNKEETGDVIFTINETTRNSKKTIYTYSGKRYKLETPVSYKITDSKDGTIREIVKNFKNSLKKIKKDKTN